MKNTSRFSITSVLFGAAFTLATGPVAAQNIEETHIREQSSAIAQPTVKRPGVQSRSISVSYSDLRLDSPAGVDTLYSRIESAAEKVCGPSAHQTGRDLGRHRDWNNCLDNAVDGAVAAVNHNSLSLHHLAETGRRVALEEQVAER